MTGPAKSNPLEDMYSEHQSWLCSWLQRKTGCSFQAADLAQDTFLRILSSPKYRHEIDQIREPRHFLSTIARRLWIDFVRRDRLEKAWLEALQLEPEPLSISSEEQTIILETLMQLDKMLEGLGEKVRQTFLMSHLEGLRYGEIAQRLQVSTSSVKKYMAKATEQCLLLMLDDDLNKHTNERL